MEEVQSNNIHGSHWKKWGSNDPLDPILLQSMDTA